MNCSSPSAAHAASGLMLTLTLGGSLTPHKTTAAAATSTVSVSGHGRSASRPWPVAAAAAAYRDGGGGYYHRSTKIGSAILMRGQRLRPHFAEVAAASAAAVAQVATGAVAAPDGSRALEHSVVEAMQLQPEVLGCPLDSSVAASPSAEVQAAAFELKATTTATEALPLASSLLSSASVSPSLSPIESAADVESNGTVAEIATPVAGTNNPESGPVVGCGDVVDPNIAAAAANDNATGKEESIAGTMTISGMAAHAAPLTAAPSSKVSTVVAVIPAEAIATESIATSGETTIASASSATRASAMTATDVPVTTTGTSALRSGNDVFGTANTAAATAQASKGSTTTTTTTATASVPAATTAMSSLSAPTTWRSQLASAVFLVLALLICHFLRLGLTEGLLVAAVRAYVQLMGIGFALRYVFEIDHFYPIFISVSVMVAIAGMTASKRAKAVPNALQVATTVILAAAATALSLSVWLGVVPPRPRFVIPIAGIVVGSTMTISANTMQQLANDMRAYRGQVEAALALGATPFQACEGFVRRAVKFGVGPSIDFTKTIGLIQLPGAMTGMIMGGASVAEAVSLQIVVTLVLLGTCTLASVLAAYLSAPQFFDRGALLDASASA